jgi:hypothetical protein
MARLNTHFVNFPFLRCGILGVDGAADEPVPWVRGVYDGEVLKYLDHDVNASKGYLPVALRRYEIHENKRTGESSRLLRGRMRRWKELTRRRKGGGRP